jgi:hypothetical protein
MQCRDRRNPRPGSRARRGRPGRRQRRDARIVGIDDDDALGRHEADDLAEGLDDGGEVREEVGVVVLDVADEEVPGLVVEEFGAAVEESRVVLVALEDEVGALSAPVSAAEVLHLAAHQKARLPPRIEQKPGRQGRGRRLAVRAGDDDRGPAGQQVPPDGLWQGEDGKAAARGLGRLDVVAQGRIADDDGVAVGRDVLGRETLRDRDAELLDQGGHGRVERAVAARNAVAFLEQEGRQRDHGGAADRDEVETAVFAHLSARSLV